MQIKLAHCARKCTQAIGWLGLCVLFHKVHDLGKIIMLPSRKEFRIVVIIKGTANVFRGEQPFFCEIKEKLKFKTGSLFKEKEKVKLEM